MAEELSLAERMKVVVAAEQEARERQATTGERLTVEGSRDISRRATEAAKEVKRAGGTISTESIRGKITEMAEPKLLEITPPQIVTLPDGSIAQVMPDGTIEIIVPAYAPWEFPGALGQYPGLDIADISAQLEQYAPTPTTYEALTEERLLNYIENALAAETITVQDPDTGVISQQHKYDDAYIQSYMSWVVDQIGEWGFGAQTPHYGDAQQYYAQIASVEASFNTAQMTPADYMDFQLALMNMVNNQNIAQFQAEMQQANWGMQLQLSQQELAAQLQIAMKPYEQMTAWQQAQLQQAQQGDPNAAAQLELERELGLMPYEQATVWQQMQAEMQQQQLELEEQRMMLPYEQMMPWQEEQLALERERLHYTPPISPYEEAELALRQQQLEAETAFQQQMLGQEQQQHLAQLRAEPASWLQYAAAAGQPAVVQPWMQPLMPQEYTQFGAGEPIPGFAGTEGMAGMPQLTTPSRQYQARMGPTAMEQYYGYEQARTGARPEETEWRLWSQAPPAGTYGGLRYTR